MYEGIIFILCRNPYWPTSKKEQSCRGGDVGRSRTWWWQLCSPRPVPGSILHADIGSHFFRIWHVLTCHGFHVPNFSCVAAGGFSSTVQDQHVFAILSVAEVTWGNPAGGDSSAAQDRWFHFKCQQHLKPPWLIIIRVYTIHVWGDYYHFSEILINQPV